MIIVLSANKRTVACDIKSEQGKEILSRPAFETNKCFKEETAMWASAARDDGLERLQV